MQFIVEVSEFWLDEENLESGLIRKIQSHVINEIEKSIREKVEKQVTMQVKDTVEKVLYSKITQAIDEVIAKGEMPSRNNSKELITIEAYVKECLNYKGGWQNFQDTIEKLAKQYTTEVKNRYDLLFASQIVAKLNDNGLLKENVAKLILENK